MHNQPTKPLRQAAAILFDLDDTLVSFDRHCRPAWDETCALFATRAGVPAERLRETIGAVSSAFWSDPQRHRTGRLALEETRRVLVAEALAALGVRHEGLAARIADHYSSLQESRIALFPDSIATLEYFARAGVRLALVTNGNAVLQRRKIGRFGLDKFFTHCFVEGELGFGKPDPRVFRAALSALKARPEETWCVGDNVDWDIRGAQACGITAVWKDGRSGAPAGQNGSMEEIRPDAVITEFSRLIGLWEQAGSGASRPVKAKTRSRR